MLRLLAAPATNNRSPRYMERALAAIHQAQRTGEQIVLHYGSVEDRVALIVECDDHLENLVFDPIAASYPECTHATIGSVDEAPPDWVTYSVSLELRPELFPILRHTQFEDLLNGTFADPVSGILRAVKPEKETRCSVAIQITPAGRRRRRRAQAALRLRPPPSPSACRVFCRTYHPSPWLADGLVAGPTRAPIATLIATKPRNVRKSAS